MVDYSKWDKFDASSSDDDNDEEHSNPRISSFDGEGRSVTIGPAGVTVADKSVSTNVTTSSSKATIFQLSDRNGGKTDQFIWSQDRSEVVIRKELEVSIKAADVEVLFDVITSILSVKVKSNGSYLIYGEFRYKFELIDDELCPVQWEIVSMEDDNETKTLHRVLEITLRKLSPIPGAVIWWKNVFVGDSEIDVTTIPDRVKSNTGAGNEASRAWEEAHRMFKEKVSNQQPIVIDCDENSTTDAPFESVADNKGVESSIKNEIQTSI